MSGSPDSGGALNPGAPAFVPRPGLGAPVLNGLDPSAPAFVAPAFVPLAHNDESVGPPPRTGWGESLDDSPGWDRAPAPRANGDASFGPPLRPVRTGWRGSQLDDCSDNEQLVLSPKYAPSADIVDPETFLLGPKPLRLRRPPMRSAPIRCLFPGVTKIREIQTLLGRSPRPSDALYRRILGHLGR